MSAEISQVNQAKHTGGNGKQEHEWRSEKKASEGFPTHTLKMTMEIGFRVFCVLEEWQSGVSILKFSNGLIFASEKQVFTAPKGTKALQTAKSYLC